MRHPRNAVSDSALPRREKQARDPCSRRSLPGMPSLSRIVAGGLLAAPCCLTLTSEDFKEEKPAMGSFPSCLSTWRRETRVAAEF